MALHGEGSIFFDKSNDRWVWQWSYELPNGEKATKKIVAKKKADLRKKAEVFKFTVQQGIEQDANITVGQWIDKWLEVIVKPTVKASTHNIYRQKTAYVKAKFGHMKLVSISSIELQAFFNELAIEGGTQGKGLSKTTVNAVRRYFKTCCTAAVDNGILKKNPVEVTKQLRQKKKKIVVMDEKEMIRFLKVAKDGDYIYEGVSNPKYLNYNDGTKYLIQCYYNLVNTALATGMRISELRGLTWKCVNMSKKYIEVKQQLKDTSDEDEFDDPKSDYSNRKIGVNPMVLEELKAFKKYQKKYADMLGDQFKNDKNLVFTNMFGTPISINNFRRRYYNKMLVRAKIAPGFTIHSMRHTHATILLMRGINVKVVSERLGHSNINITLNIYAHVLKAMEETAADMWEEILTTQLKEDTNHE